MVRTKNVSALGGGDDEDPPCPFRQVKGKIVYLEQQEGRKKQRMDRAARAALAAAAAAEQAKRGGQLQISSDQIAYRVRRLASRPRSSAPSTPTTTTTPPPTSPAPVSPEPSTVHHFCHTHHLHHSRFHYSPSCSHFRSTHSTSPLQGARRDRGATVSC
jgi:hypothetical protein